VRSPRSSTIYQLVQRYGRAQETGDQAAAEEAWRLLQGKFSNLEDLKFEVVKRNYDPLNRARGGRVEQIPIEANGGATKAPTSRPEGDK